MTRDEFFTALQNGAKWDIGVSINRTNPVPIDSKSVFQTYELLETYAETDPTAHPGQIVAVVGVSEVSAYLITSTGEGAVIQKLAASSASGDIEQDVIQLQTQVANIISGTQVVARATGDASGNNIEETYATKAVATTSTDGLMSVADKTKLEGIAAGAQVNVIEGVAIQTTADGGYTDLQIVAKKAQLDLSNYATKADLTSIPKFSIEVVTELPTQDISTTTIYLKLQETGDQEGQDIYDEYIYVNNKWEVIGNTDIDLSAYSTTVQMNAAIQAAIQALDFTELTVGATKTLGVISQTDGVLTATAVDIAIPHTAITDWDAELAQKQDVIDVEGEGFLKKTSTGFEVDTSTYTTQTQVEGLIETEITALDLANTYLGIGAKAVSASTADKVANKLTIGSKEFDGSAEVTVTATDLGALTAVPQATAEALGGIKVGYTTSGNNVAVQLDDDGKAYVAVPAATAYTAGEGLDLTGSEFSIAENGVVTSMISDGAVTDAKIAAVNVNKLEQTAGDTLILNGGTAS